MQQELPNIGFQQDAKEDEELQRAIEKAKREEIDRFRLREDFELYNEAHKADRLSQFY